MNEMISKGSKLIEDAKDRYFKKIGTTLSSPETGIKSYWSLINRFLNKAKIPIIPPLLENDIFVLDFTAKAEIFNEYFLQQCTTIDTGSTIPQNVIPIAPPLNEFTISRPQSVLNKLVMKTCKLSSLLKNFSFSFICKIVFVCRMISRILDLLCQMPGGSHDILLLLVSSL